ncbi:efflux RND transporter periplasmic adaptor subunit [Thiohalomonas denitrificans]|uniref:Membrane fusion protein, multidrug efflux system n=1 Tax=Thiohalomonas denitrificans TaxID=415747 RepID=A0A1G5PT61_9GAMM|nr:efflux RND transporter periplasmic adaptor subunit [Thiohalomonas denitrificans]SCZ52805.1 membrane fusion protein, multidrug efflux system [Thiohalomonas denitrificans]
MKPNRWKMIALLAFGLGLTGCSESTGSPEQQHEPGEQAAPPQRVETAPVQLSLAPWEAVRIGTLHARRQVRISNQEEGRLTQLPLYEGDRVEAGELLFALDDTLLRAELRKAQAQHRQAKLDLRRVRELQDKRLGTEDELARAGTALHIAQAEEELLTTRLGYTRVVAPFDGVVAARKAEPGDSLPRYSHVLTLIDPSSLVTRVTLSELLLPDLAAGQAAEVTIDALGSESLPARILRVHPIIDATSRRGLVEVALKDPPAGARQGQLCRVTLRGRSTPQLTVPYAALRRDAAGEFVVAITEGTASRVPVISGRSVDDRIVVTGPLEPEQPVVIKGFLGLKNGAAVESGDTP